MAGPVGNKMAEMPTTIQDVNIEHGVHYIYRLVGSWATGTGITYTKTEFSAEATTLEHNILYNEHAAVVFPFNAVISNISTNLEESTL